MLSPPPSVDPKWYAPHVAYTIAKMGMSLCVLGMAAEFSEDGIAVNALWPRSLIATDALNMIPDVSSTNARTPEIVADAAHAILVMPSRQRSGEFLIDDEVLAACGCGFRSLCGGPGQPLLPDLFLD